MLQSIPLYYFAIVTSGDKMPLYFVNCSALLGHVLFIRSLRCSLVSAAKAIFSTGFISHYSAINVRTSAFGAFIQRVCSLKAGYWIKTKFVRSMVISKAWEVSQPSANVGMNTEYSP